MVAFFVFLKSLLLTTFNEDPTLIMSTIDYIITCFAILLLIVGYLSPRAKTMTSYWVIYIIEILVLMTIMNLSETLLTARGIPNANAMSFITVMIIALLLGLNGWKMQKRIKGYEDE